LGGQRGLALASGATVFFAVTLARGGPWDWSRDLRDQQGFEQHARFMDALVEDGFILLGGPLALEREVLHIVRAASEDEVRRRLAADLWHQNGMLSVSSIRSWTVLLDGLGLIRSESPR
jgi:uncharacterized protein YciI